MKAKEFIPQSKPRNFVAKNQKTGGAGAHKDKKKAEKQGDVKHKLKQFEDAEPMDREFALVKKLGRLGERIVENPKLWNRYEEENNSGDPDWIISLIQDGTGATFNEVLKLSDLFSEIGGGMGRIIDFAWAVKEGTWEEDFMNPYKQHRSKDINEFSFDDDDERKKHELGMINAFLKSGKNPAPGSPIYALMKKYGLAEGMRDPEDWDEGNTEPPNNFAIYINGKKWKVFKGRGQFADDYKERDHYRQLQSWAQKKSDATGKKWTVHITGEPATD